MAHARPYSEYLSLSQPCHNEDQISLETKKYPNMLRDRTTMILLRKFSHPKMWGRSSVGRALQWHCRGRRFDPVRFTNFRRVYQAHKPCERTTENPHKSIWHKFGTVMEDFFMTSFGKRNNRWHVQVRKSGHSKTRSLYYKSDAETWAQSIERDRHCST